MNSTTIVQKAIAPSAFAHDLGTTLGTPPVSFVRSRVVAHLEQWGCPIHYGLVRKFPGKPERLQAVIVRGRSLSAIGYYSRNLFGKNPNVRGKETLKN